MVRRQPGRQQQRDTGRTSAASPRVFIDPKANEAYVADGYFNKRVAVIDMDSGKIKRYWGAYGNKPDDAPLARYDPKAPTVAAVPHAGALRGDVERRHGLRLRPSERPHPGLHEGRQVREGEAALPGHAVGRLGVGHRLLARPAAELPVRRRRRQRARLHRRPPVARGAHAASATGGRQPGSSSACTASPWTRRATSTRPRPTPGNACRSSCSRAWVRRRRARRGRRASRAGRAGKAGQVKKTFAKGREPQGSRPFSLTCPTLPPDSPYLPTLLP